MNIVQLDDLQIQQWLGNDPEKSKDTLEQELFSANGSCQVKIGTVVVGFLNDPVPPPPAWGSQAGANTGRAAAIANAEARRAELEARRAAALANPPPPSECQCRDWAGAPSCGHHALCEWKDPWESKQRGLGVHYLVDLEDQSNLREATIEEIEEAKENGGVIEVDGVGYGVIQ